VEDRESRGKRVERAERGEGRGETVEEKGSG
jgi:hypothetical protein